MEYIFLFAIVTPLALLILNLTGFRAGGSPDLETTMAFDAPVARPAVTVPDTAPALIAPTSPVAPGLDTADKAAGVLGLTAKLSGVVARTRRNRRDYFGDYSPMDSVQTLAAAEPADAEIYLMPRRDVAPAMVLSGPPAAHARPGGTLVSFPSHTPLVAQRNVAQR